MGHTIPHAVARGVSWGAQQCQLMCVQTRWLQWLAVAACWCSLTDSMLQLLQTLNVM